MLLLFFSIALCKNEDPIQTPKAHPISVSTRMMDISGDVMCDLASKNCSPDDFEEPFALNCRQICWSNNGNATFSYTFRGIQFLVYGRHNKTVKFNLFVDNINLGGITEKQSDEKVDQSF